MSIPNTLNDIITKVRRVTGRLSSAQLSDQEIIKYVNTFYIYDMPEHLKFESLRVNYQFVTNANTPVYDMPTDIYLTAMPPVYIGGYQSFMTQSRQNFFRINPELNYLQQSVYTGNGSVGPYTGQFLINTPLIPGFKQNPPGAYTGATNDTQTRFINWNVLISGLDASGNSQTLVDDGFGNLVSPDDPFVPGISPPSNYIIRGTVDYITGAIDVNSTGFVNAIDAGQPINVQYIPYVASRPQSVLFFQDQFILWPVPDQAYTVSFEAYQYPATFKINTNGTFNGAVTPQVQEWWQLLAYGAADKIFADNADFESMQKFRPLLEEQMSLCLRRTVVQQTSERTSTIYTEQNATPGYGYGNLFGGFA